MDLLQQLAEKIAKENNLDASALLGKNDKIFYLLINESIVEVERSTHISKCITVSYDIYKLIEALQTLNNYLKTYDYEEISR
jgi:hypothetical protein